MNSEKLPIVYRGVDYGGYMRVYPKWDRNSDHDWEEIVMFAESAVSMCLRNYKPEGMKVQERLLRVCKAIARVYIPDDPALSNKLEQEMGSSFMRHEGIMLFGWGQYATDADEPVSGLLGNGGAAAWAKRVIAANPADEASEQKIDEAFPPADRESEPI